MIFISRIKMSYLSRSITVETKNFSKFKNSKTLLEILIIFNKILFLNFLDKIRKTLG